MFVARKCVLGYLRVYIRNYHDIHFNTSRNGAEEIRTSECTVVENTPHQLSSQAVISALFLVYVRIACLQRRRCLLNAEAST